MRHITYAFLCFLFFCLAACGEPLSLGAGDVGSVDPLNANLPEGLAASFDGGEISFPEVEKAIAPLRTPACVESRRRGGSGGVDLVIDCYKEVAEALAVEKLVLAKVADHDKAIEELGEDYNNIVDGRLLTSFNKHIRDPLSANDEEIAGYYREHQDRFRIPRSYTLSNIFRRHENTNETEGTMGFLRALKQRVEEGESFHALAREHSHSETRGRGGVIGHLSADKLPRVLADAIAGLDSGEVSDPIPVKGGAVLLHVKNVSFGSETSLADAKNAIRVQLVNEKAEKAVDVWLARRELAGELLILEETALLAALDGEETSAAVYRIGGKSLSAAEFRKRAGLTASLDVAGLPVARRDRVVALYQQLTRARLLTALLRTADGPPEDRFLSEAVRDSREQGLSMVADQRLRDDMWRKLDSDDVALKQFYRDNAHHYQSEARYKVKRWDLPFAQDPALQLKKMEEIHVALTRGDLQLEAAVDRLGGTIRDFGWRDSGDLGELTGKIRRRLATIVEGGYSVPYREGDALHIVLVEKREHPKSLSFNEAREALREDFFQRYRRKLYAEVVSEHLARAGFVFSANNVRSRLLPDPVMVGAPAVGGTK